MTTLQSVNLLGRLEAFFDKVPRDGADVEEHGPLTLFVRRGAGWPFYARPTLGKSGPVQVEDVDRVRARQRELGIRETFEWVDETSPTMRAAVAASGLQVHEHPLMVLLADAAEGSVPALPASVAVGVLTEHDPALPGAITLPELAFADPGTQVGTVGPADLARSVAECADDGTVDRAAARIRSGLTVVAAAVEGGTVLCSGQHNRVDTVSEIVAVGTLPSARRRGLAAAVTRVLVDNARSAGVSTIFLSASDEEVQRLYERLGFRRIGTALTAE